MAWPGVVLVVRARPGHRSAWARVRSAVARDIRDGLLKPLMRIDALTDLGEVGRPEKVLMTTGEMAG